MDRKLFCMASLFLFSIVLSINISANAEVDNFSLTILKEDHSRLVEHSTEVEIKNLDTVSNHNFNPKILFTNLSFDTSQVNNVYVYEWKAVNTSFAKPLTQVIETNSTYPKDMANFSYPKSCWNETKSNKVFPCNVTKIIGTGSEWKMQTQWKPTKMQLAKTNYNVSTIYGSINIAKGGSKCDADDFNTTYNCNGTKRFKIIWETPVTVSNGWGSSGYYEVSDNLTGNSYDPAWGNTTFTKRIEANYTNPDTKAHTNERVMFHLANYTDILTYTQASFQDVRVTNENGTDAGYQLVYYQNQTRPDAVTWRINLTAGETGRYYIYFNSSTALDANRTNFNYYEFFENGSIYMSGGFTPFEGDTGGLVRNVSHTHNTTNVTSLSSGQANGAPPASFRHIGGTEPGKDINNTFAISWWQRSNGTFGAYNGLEQATGPNLWGLVVNDTGRILILNGSNGLGNWVPTPHILNDPDTWYFFQMEKNESGEYYFFTNTTNKFFLGRDEALSENYTQVSLGKLASTGAGTGGPLFEDFLVIQNQPGASSWYNEYPIGAVLITGQTENVTACGTYNSNYTMLNSINNVATSCIIIDAPNVIFNCASFTIDGTDAGSSIGINVSSRAANATINNCIISDWDEGTQTNAANTRIDNVTVFSNNEGIFFANVPASSNGLVTSSNISRNTIGINSRGAGHVFENSTIDANGLEGLLLNGVLSNTANGITARYNGREGIVISTGGSHTIINNVANSNSGSGISAVGTSNLVFYNNTANGNTLSGNVFQTSTTTSNVENNTMFGNINWDFNATGTVKLSDMINLRITGTSNITLERVFGIAIRNISVGAIPTDPSNDYRNIGVWLNITNVSDTSYVFINITYLATDIPAGFLEGNLSWAKYNGTAWQNLTSNFANTYGVDTVNNVVWANITNFTGQMGGVVFAPLVNNISILSVDVTAPTIDYTTPTETNLTYLNRNWFIVNTSATDNIAISNTTHTVYNLTGLYNETTTTENAMFRNYTGLAEGNFTFNATTTDTSNNRGYNQTRRIIIDLTLPTSINFTSPTPSNNTYQNWNHTFVNATIVDIHLDNSTATIFNTTGLFNTTTLSGSSFAYNFTNIRDDNYTIWINSTDKANNLNRSSESRFLLIDTVLPTGVNFTGATPANGTAISGTVTLNGTATDNNLRNLTFYLDSTTVLGTCEKSSCAVSWNTANTDTGTHFVNVTATDAANNQNTSLYYTFTIDNTVAVASAGAGGASGQLGFNFTYKKLNITGLGVIPLELPEDFWNNLNTLISIPVPLPDGEYVLQVKPIALIVLFAFLFVVVITLNYMRKKNVRT